MWLKFCNYIGRQEDEGEEAEVMTGRGEKGAKKKSSSLIMESQQKTSETEQSRRSNPHKVFRDTQVKTKTTS